MSAGLGMTPWDNVAFYRQRAAEMEQKASACRLTRLTHTGI